MIKTTTFIFYFILFSAFLAEAQVKKGKEKDKKGDFFEIKVPQKVWQASDSMQAAGNLLSTFQKGDSITMKLDTLIDGKGERNNELTTPSLIGINGTKTTLNGNGTALKLGIAVGGSTKPNLHRALIPQRLDWLQEDTLKAKKPIQLFANSLYESISSSVDLNVKKTNFREDTTNLYDVNIENIVIVSEEVAIDCVWVTMTNYYSVWDSEDINPYQYKIDNFKDSVNLTLFDSSQSMNWSPPLASLKLTSVFGFRRYRWHHGVDLDLNTGDPVFATFNGIVRIARYDRGGYGNFVVLRHYNGLETLYGHLSAVGVRVGQTVAAGEQLGKGGSTGRSSGPHLHYEVRYLGYAFDPKFIYNFESQSIITNIFKLTPEHFKHLVNHRQSVYHVIRRGESLGRLSSRYRVSVSQLCRLNRISTRTTLKVGRRLRIR